MILAITNSRKEMIRLPGKARASLRRAHNRLRESMDGPIESFDVDLVRIALAPGLWTTDLEAVESRAIIPETGAVFLDGVLGREPENEEWLETERRAASATVTTRLRDAIYARVANEGPDSAIPLALRLVAPDRLDEDNHRLLMRLYAQSGQRSQALAQFERLNAVLRDELGEVPDAKPKCMKIACLGQSSTKASPNCSEQRINRPGVLFRAGQ